MVTPCTSDCANGLTTFVVELDDCVGDEGGARVTVGARVGDGEGVLVGTGVGDGDGVGVGAGQLLGRFLGQ